MPPLGKPDLDMLLEALEAIKESIAVYGPDLRPLYANTVARRRFRGLYADMLGKGQNFPEALSAAVRRASPDKPDHEIERITAKIYEYHCSGKPHRIQTEENRTALVTVLEISQGRRVEFSVDVTELQEHERELKKARVAAEAASAAKSAFLANMSHEIRTPLNGILGMAQVLAGSNLDDEQRDYVATILESGQMLTTLLNDVLDLSKIEAGKLDIVPAEGNLVHILRRLQTLWLPKAEEKELELSFAFDPELPAMLSFDAVRVQQCVTNLISNAIKFTDVGRVHVFVSSQRLDEKAHLIEISVADTGIGMDEKTLGRLFKPFMQADQTTARKHGGTGLGLSITSKLAEVMGGGASAESAPGKGSTFRFTFRALEAKQQTDVARSHAPANMDIEGTALKGRGLRVLLVDDHPVNRQVAGLFLRPLDIEVVEASDGREALYALERQPFDLVLLDMHMPVMDGPTTFRHIRESGRPYANIPVIALTANAMGGDREHYLGLGINGYVAKPLAPRDLLTEIMRVRDNVAASSGKALRA